ncbi:PRTRC system protein B [Shewanella bicestrii]|uniref:PRTRC system protein B n=1 Tax=Shewanella xiamenensis TaxID=332186 RepID=UPI00217CE689|nr:PRTRC system protein B [Shewanella xiamenensis]MCT8869025.1 PRTRC system protein B [Shewanella xiamenensis]MCT8873710.1 PRTRC system protein B [Shewanella xiamenensis]UWH40019.1 PRTRC system protein B [Shewanella xiamenensis]
MNIEMTTPTSLVEQFIQANLGDEKEIRSQLAIVIHGNNTGSRTCITRHKINNGKLLLGDVISIDDLAEAVTDMQSRNESNSLNAFADYIEPHIIAQNSKILAWYTPRKEQTLFLTKSSVLVTLPPLLYVYKPAIGNGIASLSVFALASNKRPNTNTKLYHAPLMNIYQNGSVCLGTMKIPQQMSGNIIDVVEKEFFGSKFTHPNHNQLTRKPVNIEEFYRQKEKSGQRILTSELMPINSTVGQILRGR